MSIVNTQKIKFSIKDFFSFLNPQFPADLFTFTKEIFNGKLHFSKLLRFKFLEWIKKIMFISAVCNKAMKNSNFLFHGSTSCYVKIFKNSSKKYI